MRRTTNSSLMSFSELDWIQWCIDSFQKCPERISPFIVEILDVIRTNFQDKIDFKQTTYVCKANAPCQMWIVRCINIIRIRNSYLRFYELSLKHYILKWFQTYTNSECSAAEQTDPGIRLAQKSLVTHIEVTSSNAPEKCSILFP